jgi:two-component system chemotaxis sensor kinase CheA
MSLRPDARATREFLSEASEIIDGMRRGLATIDTARRQGAPAPTTLNEIFRGAHSLKGLAGMFGIDGMGTLAHELESLLDGLRLGRIAVDDLLLSHAYASMDIFAHMLDELSRGVEIERGRVDVIVENLRALARGGGQGVVAVESEILLPREALAVLTEYEEHRLQENLRQGTPLWRVRAPLAFDTFESSLSTLNAFLASRGEVITTLPSTDAASDGITFDLLLAAELDGEVLSADLRALSTKYDIERIDRQKTVTRPPTSMGPLAFVEDEMTARHTPETVRVNITKLDELMGIVGELVLSREGLVRVSDALKAETGYRGLAVDLHRLVRSMTRRIAELQIAIMQVRMIPLSQVFERLEWIVSRTAGEVGKEVKLVVSGEDTELDKLIVEELVDPLMHLVRNAIDHGLESPSEREALGKNRQGTITVTAFPRGNHVVIDLKDDGRGFDDVAIKRTALERKIVDEDRVGSLSRREVWDLLFLPGFSTRREVTGTSGRGVGLDVVKHNIARLSGIIDLESEAGMGTRFTITLPITLAILQALIVRVMDSTFCLPLSSVLEVVVLQRSDLCTVDAREMATVRGETLPLIRLDKLFQMKAPQRSTRAAEEREGIGYAVVVALAQHRVALFIEDVTGQQDIVIKPLGALLSGVRGFSGATQLGDNETVLVLDVAAIVQDHFSTADLRRTGVEASVAP